MIYVIYIPMLIVFAAWAFVLGMEHEGKRRRRG